MSEEQESKPSRVVRFFKEVLTLRDVMLVICGLTATGSVAYVKHQDTTHAEDQQAAVAYTASVDSTVAWLWYRTDSLVVVSAAKDRILRKHGIRLDVIEDKVFNGKTPPRRVVPPAPPRFAPVRPALRITPKWYEFWKKDRQG